MAKKSLVTRKLILVAGLAGIGTAVPACTEEEARAVLAGVQVVVDELDEGDDISFGDWVRSELDD